VPRQESPRAPRHRPFRNQHEPPTAFVATLDIGSELNRAENSHQPTRHRERAMKRFRTPGAAQRFLAVFSAISPHFRPHRHRLTADDYRTEMTRRFAVFNQVTGPTAAA
jgi:hypothetical protein